MNRYRYALIAGMFIVATLLVFVLPREQASVAADFAALIGVIGVVTAAVAWPRGAAFIKRRPRSFAIAGWTLCAAGFLGVVALPLALGLQSPSPADPAQYGGLVIALLGYMIARLPKMTAQAELSRARLAMLAPEDKARAAFDGVHEGLGAILSVGKDWRMFLQIAGPWAFLPACMVLWVVVWAPSVGRDGQQALLLLLVVFVLLLLMCLAFPTVLVAWVRWIAREQKPPLVIALPDGPTFSVAWRLLVFLMVIGAIDRAVIPGVTSAAKSIGLGDGSLVGLTLALAIDAGAAMLYSNFALRLPALAVRDDNFPLAVALTQGRRLWPGLPVGLAIAAIPVIAARFLVGAVTMSVSMAAISPSRPSPQPAAGWALVVGLGFLVTLAGLASVATLVSRAYSRAKAAASVTLF